MTRVVVADDQELVRHGIRTLLDIAGIEVAGEARNGQEALEVVARTAPDVLLLDLRMPVRDGLWAVRALRESGDETPVLVLTTFDDDELVLGALQGGAQGYLLKDVTVEQLVRAVEVLASGGTYVAPSLTARMMQIVRARPTGTAEPAALAPLSLREQEVLRLVADGRGNREISGILHITEGTVKNHVSAILTKLGARDRTNAVLRALRHQLI